jgi:hypothetical protein
VSSEKANKKEAQSRLLLLSLCGPGTLRRGSPEAKTSTGPGRRGSRSCLLLLLLR